VAARITGAGRAGDYDRSARAARVRHPHPESDHERARLQASRADRLVEDQHRRCDPPRDRTRVGTVRNIKWFCVQDVRGHVEDGKVAHWQVTIKVGFTLEG